MPLRHVHCHIVTERQSDVLHKQIVVTEIQYIIENINIST